MKKTMILLLGALVASVLPGNDLQAQVKRISVKVKTIDRAAIDTAVLYNAASPNDTLCIDPTNPAIFSYTGTAIPVNTVDRWPGTLRVSGSTDSLFGMVNSAFTNAVLVVRDVNMRYYVWGNASQEMLEMGIFRGSDLFAGADTTYYTMTAESNMLCLSNPANATVAEDIDYRYTSITAAAANSPYTTIRLRSDSPALRTDSITTNMNLHLMSYKVNGTLQLKGDSPITISGDDGSAVSNLFATTGTGNVRIIRIDSVGFLSAGSTHPIEIVDGRFSHISPSANLSIAGGKYNQAPSVLSAYVVPGSFLYSNPDADASSFAYKISNSGYQVTLKNYNAIGGDSIIVCEGGLIVPAISRPANVPAEWLFQHYWKDSVNSTNPWLFDRDSVDRDTILYARWDYYDPTTTNLVRVRHHLQDLDNSTSYTLADSVDYAVTADTSFEPEASRFPGFHDQAPMTIIPYTFASAADTTIIDFYYDRNTYLLTWNINYRPGQNATMNLTDSVVPMLYGAPIVYPVVTRAGYHVSSWNPNLTTMPARDVTIQPSYERNRYGVVWSASDTVDYNALDHLPSVSAYATSSYDTLMPEELTFEVTDRFGNPANQIINVAGSPYAIKAVPVDTNCRIYTNMVHYIHVSPYKVYAVDIEVDTIKLYDGTQNVNRIYNSGRPDVILSDATGTPDDLTIEGVTVENVRFNDQEPGENKVIRAYGVYLGGSDSSNYILMEDTLLISRNGVILYFGLNDTLVHGFDADYMGYCNDNSYIVEFHLAPNATNPNMYSIDFESDLFTDIISSPINREGFVDLVVPDGTPAGIYNASVVFWKSDYPTYKSNPHTLTFIVNLDKDVIMPIFDSVMTVMNADPNMIIDTNTVMWFNSTDNGLTWDTIRNADSTIFYGPFIKPQGGLNGLYYVEFSYYDSTGVRYTARSCAQENITEYPNAPVEMSVKAYPNPTVNTVNINLENATQFTHTLRVMNIMGVTMLNTTFNGDATSIDFSRFVNGSYTVSVDGIVVRVIKK